MMENITRRTFVAGASALAATAAAEGAASALADAAKADDAAKPADGALPADGVYVEEVEGRNGLVTVEVTFGNGQIVSVVVVDQQETEVFTADAIPQLCQEIVAAQSFGIDGVSGATFTSAAILTAVRQAIVDAGSDPEQFNKPSQVEKGTDETVDVDVAVVGAGMSGILTAARAAEAGATVALVEKVRLIGGCSLMSFMSAMYAPEDASTTMVQWVTNQMYLADPSLIFTYVQNTTPAVQWLAGATETSMFPYLSDPNSMFPTMLEPYMDRPTTYSQLMDSTVLANGGQVYTDTCATALIHDDAGVHGVTCTRKDGSTLTVNAKATVIATGGLGGDTAWLKDLTGYDVVCGCLTQDVGEGMKMAWDAGAEQPKNLGGMMLHQTLALAKLRGYPLFQQQMPMICGYVPSFLDVNTAGVRFRNEDWVNVATAASNGGAFAGGVTYAMMDQAMVDALVSGGTAAIGFADSPGMPPEYKPDFAPDTPWENFQQVLDDCVAHGDGWAYKGDTVEDLAAAAGMDAAVLQATLDQYNGYCADGVDALFGKDPAHLVAIQTAPFYLVGITYNQLGTVGGVNVNSQFQALDANRKAIPGLYSVGSDAYGTCWNRNYYGQGDGVGFALVSGYVAGPIVAAYALNG